MTEVSITAENGRVLRIAHVTVDDEDGWTYSADLELETARAGIAVYEYGDPGLPTFFAGLASDWQGFEGVREFESLEGQIRVTARHDGLGMVRCVVTLRQPWPPGWTLEAELEFGAGAHLERISAELIDAFARARSSRHDSP